MAADNVIRYLLELEDRVSKELKHTADAAGDAGDEVEQLKKQFRRAGKQARSSTGTMNIGLRALTGPIGAAVSAVANAAKNFVSFGVKAISASAEAEAGILQVNTATGEWQNGLSKVVETNKGLAGETVRVAQAFDGLISGLNSQFNGFAKQVGDAKLFSTAKATLAVVLEQLKDGKGATQSLAEATGNTLAKALLVVVDIAGKLLIITNRIRLSWDIVGQAILVARIAVLEMDRSLNEMWESMGFDTTEQISRATNEIARLNGEFAKSANAVDDLRQTEQDLALLNVNMVEQIEALADEYQRAADASKGIAPPGGGGVASMMGLDPKAAEAGAKAAVEVVNGSKQMSQALKALSKHLDKTAKASMNSAKATRPQLKESEKLTAAAYKMSEDFILAYEAAYTLGPEGISAFNAVSDSMTKNMEELASTIPEIVKKEKAAALAAGVGAVAGGAADIMQTGGVGMLGGMGPIGAAAAGLIGAGKMGATAYDQAVDKQAALFAQQRQEQMKQARAMQEARGATEAELIAMGLGREDIAEAGEVTEKDIAKAEKATDRGEQTANAIRQIIEGVNAAVLNLITTLPDVLMMLTKGIATKLPMALMDVIPQLIKELIPVLLFKLPEAILKMIVKLVPTILKMFFVDLIPAIFKGVARWWRNVWKAIRNFFTIGKKQTGGFIPRTDAYLLHQGERVVPASGASTGTSSKGLGAFTAGSPSLTVNTNVVSPDTISDLSILIDREMGAMGRGTVPIWGATGAMREL